MRFRTAYDYDDVLLVPKTGVISSRADADIISFIAGDTPVGIPIISANMPSVTESLMAIAMWNAGAVGCLHRFSSIQQNVTEYLGCDLDGADAICSLGLKDWEQRSWALSEAGASLFLFDVAHGDHRDVYTAVQDFRKKYPSLGLIVGNIVTREAANAFLGLGVDALKVGIGPGRACITRYVTGFGVPQLTAIMDVREAIEDFGDPQIRLIADGGIKTSGDIVKALAAGADTVMIGSLLAGCNEAPNPGQYFGSASHLMNGHHAPEGIEVDLPVTGSVEAKIKELAWGIKSGISYAGARNIQELRENADWVEVRRIHGT